MADVDQRYRNNITKYNNWIGKVQAANYSEAIANGKELHHYWYLVLLPYRSHIYALSHAVWLRQYTHVRNWWPAIFLCHFCSHASDFAKFTPGIIFFAPQLTQIAKTQIAVGCMWTILLKSMDTKNCIRKSVAHLCIQPKYLPNGLWLLTKIMNWIDLCSECCFYGNLITLLKVIPLKFE